ncbi:ABC transporter permease [Sphaerisporangium krabiense]|uniref:ABC-2 type transport system permease protein n=1 Tax=Sphaerisporangium krabiense TaxID=763782 RepID=A0A7W8Z6P8_9ACTN|nr:ABC transporter permease [Sphaerisporangium krabiense]MBB5628512.1 ABC-2 type transport system permease protein [Sphaerisporangium krabiense]GII67153.1 ABC transporter permease [Sphaerisporangium krabiense]
MNPVLLVARREIDVRGRTRGYRWGLLVTAVLVAVLAALPKLIGGGGSDYAVGLAGAQADRLQATLTAQAAQASDTTVKVVRYPDEAAARKGVAAGDVEAAIVDNVTVIAKSVVDDDLSVLLDTAHRVAATEGNLTAAGIDPAKVGQAQQVAPLKGVSLDGTGEDATVRRVIATVIVVLLFMLLIQVCTWVAMGVVEEKGSRIIEILLTAVRPWQLLTGKVIGLGVLGLAQIVVIAVAGLAATRVTGSIPDLPDGTYGVVASAIGWFLLGYLFYAAVFAAIASLVSRQEELSGVLTPATMLLMASYLVSFVSVASPDGTLTRVLSVVPPFSAMVMPVRSAVVPVPLWEMALAAVLMVAAAAIVLRIGGLVYQRAVLRTGARVKWREALARAS